MKSVLENPAGRQHGTGLTVLQDFEVSVQCSPLSWTRRFVVVDCSNAAARVHSGLFIKRASGSRFCVVFVL